MTDLWPQSGRIVDVLTIGFCYADAAITENYCVKLGTSAANRVPVAVSAAVGDSVGVALKAASAAGDIIPVLFFGVVRMVATAAITIGQFVVSSDSGAKVKATTNVNTYFKAFGGSSYLLGLAIQAAGAGGADTILILVGRSV